MFDYIKNNASSYAYDLIAENSTASKTHVKDIFLDDPDAMSIAAENDPEIAKFIEKIPEDPEAEEITDEDIDELAESMISEEGSSLIAPWETDDAITDRISTGRYNPDYDEWAASYNSSDDDDDDTPYSDESDDEICDRITSENTIFDIEDDFDSFVNESFDFDINDLF